MIDCDGTDSGTIYIYYENESTNKKIPLMYIKVRKSCVNRNEKVADVFGTEMILENQNENRFYNFEVEPTLLEELIAKLRETDICEKQIKKYEDKLTSYIKLLELEKNGIKT